VPAAIGLGTAFVLVVVAVLVFGTQLVGGLSLDHRRDAALDAGRQAAVNFTSFNYSTADADLKRLQDSTTPGFVASFTDDRDAFVKSLREAKVSVVGTATAAGVYDYTGDSAHVLVAIRAQFQRAPADQPAERDYRMDLVMLYQNGRWLADSAGFVA
jgi:Mce-associated membrane protein